MDFKNLKSNTITNIKSLTLPKGWKVKVSASERNRSLDVTVEVDYLIADQITFSVAQLDRKDGTIFIHKDFEKSYHHKPEEDTNRNLPFADQLETLQKIWDIMCAQHHCERDSYADYFYTNYYPQLSITSPKKLVQACEWDYVKHEIQDDGTPFSETIVKTYHKED